jgi:hypothetical protein
VPSTRSLVILAGVTAVLLLAAIWDLARPDRAAPGSRRLVPACDSVARVVWERPATAAVALQHVDGRTYELILSRDTGEVRLPADERVVDDVLGTLELLSPRRALPARRAERGLAPARLHVRVICTDGRATTLALGDRSAAMDRVWLARAGDEQHSDTDYLIEGHAARALDRSADELRARRVFARLGASLAADGLTGAARIELQQGARSLALSGRPALVHLDAAVPGARADLGQVSALVGRLRDLAIVRFGDAAPGSLAGSGAGHAEPLIIRVRDASAAEAMLEELGPCPAPSQSASPAATPYEPAPAAAPSDVSADPAGLRLVRTQLGAGCVPADALAAVAAFLDRPRQMIARTLVAPAAWQRIRILGSDGVDLVLVPRGGDVAMTVDHEGHGSETLAAERAAVDEWLSALAAAASGAVVPVAELDATPALVFSVIVQQSGVEDVVEVYRHPRSPGAAPHWLARRNGEPVYLVLDVAPHAAGIMPVEPLRFLPRTLLVREPFALREVIGSEQGRVSEHLQRGELLDDWAAAVPAQSAVRPGTVDALRQTLAGLRAVRFVADAPAPAHRLTPPRRRVAAVFDPGPLDQGAPFRDRIDIGADTPRGCLARLDAGAPGPVFELDRRVCDVLLGAWTRRSP